MDKYLLDTNVISELRKGKLAHSNVKKWAVTIHIQQQYLSVISLLEIKMGILSAVRKNPDFGAMLTEWYLEKLKPSYSGRIIRISEAESELFAIWSQKRTLPFKDGLIATTAKTNGLILVTQNVKDFKGLSVPLIDPWNI